MYCLPTFSSSLNSLSNCYKIRLGPCAPIPPFLFPVPSGAKGHFDEDAVEEHAQILPQAVPMRQGVLQCAPWLGTSTQKKHPSIQDWLTGGCLCMLIGVTAYPNYIPLVCPVKWIQTGQTLVKNSPVKSDPSN